MTAEVKELSNIATQEEEILEDIASGEHGE